jgi:polyhydroxybutyrate depolymerase
MRESIEVDGRPRTFTAVGDRHFTAPRALVLVFHGSRQTGEVHRAFTGRSYDALAADGTAVVAYLDGYRRTWNDARLRSRLPARLEGVDDVGFARAVVEHLAATHGIDPSRVVGVGYSNGGQMVMRLAHEAPELLAGAVVVAATWPAPDNVLLPAPVPPPVPMPVVLVHGTRDPIVAYRGGSMSWWAARLFKVGGRSLSAPGTARHFAERNGIAAEPVTVGLSRRPGSPRGTRVERIEYREPGRPAVALYTVRGGGHTVPGPHPAPRVIGRTTADVVAADLVAQVVAQTSRASEGTAP